MFELAAPWWELPLRVFAIYSVLLIMVRLSGKRTVGQFTPFDLLVVLLLSEAVSSGLVGGDHSVAGALLAAFTLVSLNLVVAVATTRCSWLHALVEGHPVLIGRDGRLFPDIVKKNHVPMQDVERSLREADCDLKDLKYAFLEVDGGISVLKESHGDVRQQDASERS